MKMSTQSIRTRIHQEAGFTLMELLIVMSLILIIMAIAIPGYQGIIRRGNELSALGSLKTINEEELQYQSTYPQFGYACNLAYLGGDKAAGPPTPTSAQLIPNDLASGQKQGYTFAVTNCVKSTVNNQVVIQDYEITAVPQSKGHSGNRGFCSDSEGVIKYDPQGGTNCTLPVQ